jgi:hypothetical protein
MHNIMDSTFDALSWLATGEFPKEMAKDVRKRKNGINQDDADYKNRF